MGAAASAGICAVHDLRTTYSSALMRGEGCPGVSARMGSGSLPPRLEAVSFHSLLSTFQGMDWKAGALRTP